MGGSRANALAYNKAVAGLKARFRLVRRADCGAVKTGGHARN
jgi:predicted ATPase